MTLSGACDIGWHEDCPATNHRPEDRVPCDCACGHVVESVPMPTSSLLPIHTVVVAEGSDWSVMTPAEIVREINSVGREKGEQ